MTNLVIIYLDQHLHEENTFISLLNDSFHCGIQTFDELDPCIDYITDLNDHVLLILPNVLRETLVPLIHDIHRLVCIYIICESINEPEDLTNTWRKVRRICNDTPLSYNQVHRHIRHFNETSVPITFIKSSSISNYNELGPSVMYSLLLKECIFKMDYDEDDTKEFANFCRKHHDILKISLESIQKFEDHYEQFKYDGMYSPIKLYTKESFIYSILNQALRKQNIEVILMMGFFIQDLHCHITVKYLSEELSEMIVYRGQGMSIEDLENMKQSKNGLLSFNNFLSTSKNRQISYMFADSARQDENLVGLLFEMKIDPSTIDITNIAYASLDNISVYEDEKEILFSMNTIFRIDEVKEIEDRLWQVNLTLAINNDEKLIQLTEYIRNQTVNAPRGLHRLGKLMLIMGEFNKAEEIFNVLLKRTLNDQYEQLASIHHNLAFAYHMNLNLQDTFIHYKKSLDHSLKYLSSDDPQLSAIYTNIGAALKEQGKLDEALEYLERALNITRQAPQTNPFDIALGYNNIGAVLREQGKYDEALVNFNCALEIYLQHLSQHLDLGSVYTNISAVYFSLKNFHEAFSYLEKTLKLYEKSLSFNHPLMALVHYNLACTLEKLDRHLDAVKHAKQSVDLARYSFDSTHPRMQMYQDYYDELQRTI